MTPAQHAARAHMLHESAARLWGSIGHGLSPERIGRKARAAMRLQQWAGEHLANAVDRHAFNRAMGDEHEAWNTRWDRREAARARRNQPIAA